MDADFERRFGGLRRLYGNQGAQAIFASHVVVVGLGGVGSWAAEALARSGVAGLTLVDLDQVSESNVNRQLHAVGANIGKAKVVAMQERLMDINPFCSFRLVEDFLTRDNLTELLSPPYDGGELPVVVDACDQMQAKVAMADWALKTGATLVSVGAAGGKVQAQSVEQGWLTDVTHDPLLAQLRYRLRKHHGAAKVGRIPLACVFSREAVSAPQGECTAVPENDGTLNCHGYGSVVSVTATFGMVAAGYVLNALAMQKKMPGLSEPKM